MIDLFMGENAFLSNFHPTFVKYEGVVYPNSECAFQAAKSLDINERLKFVNLTGGQAKRLGRKISLRSDWETVKLDIMKEILREKFKNPKLASKLIATNNQMLEEGNTWGDSYWGTCNGVGKNHLGKILMEIRSEIIDLKK